MGVFVDSEQKLIFESFWLRFGSICLHFSSRVPLLHATPPTFCLSDFTTPTFLFVSFYNSNLFLCRLIWHFFIVNIALANASIVQFLILYHCLLLESESWEGTKRVHQRNFHFISIRFCCCWGQSHQQRFISIVPSKLPFSRSRFPRWRTFSMFSFLFFFCINLEKNSKAG